MMGQFLMNLNVLRILIKNFLISVCQFSYFHRLFLKLIFFIFYELTHFSSKKALSYFSLIVSTLLQIHSILPTLLRVALLNPKSNDRKICKFHYLKQGKRSKRELKKKTEISDFFAFHIELN